MNRYFTKRAIDDRKRLFTDELIVFSMRDRWAIICLDDFNAEELERYFFVNRAHDLRRQPILEFSLPILPGKKEIAGAILLLDLWFGSQCELTEKQLRSRFEIRLSGADRRT